MRNLRRQQEFSPALSGKKRLRKRWRSFLPMVSIRRKRHAKSPSLLSNDLPNRMALLKFSRILISQWNRLPGHSHWCVKECYRDRKQQIETRQHGKMRGGRKHGKLARRSATHVTVDLATAEQAKHLDCVRGGNVVCIPDHDQGGRLHRRNILCTLIVLFQQLPHLGNERRRGDAYSFGIH